MLDVQNSNRFNVLLANEQESWHRTVRELLGPQGVQTVSARTGREALRLMQTMPVHVAVLDQQMPQLGGLQIVKLMRENTPADGSAQAVMPAVILLTSHMTNHFMQEALGMQVFSVLSKPVDFNLLLDSLARVLRRYHENRWPN
jgi:CheY-like chemotaxis protein